jgi:RNA polymerase sigma-70 factor (ECF subfamily)
LELVEAAIERLPDDSRLVVLLRHKEHLSFTEIGERLGRSGDAARKLWERAVERLAQEMKFADDDGRP